MQNSEEALGRQQLLWLLGSLCNLYRIAFDAKLIDQGYPIVKPIASRYDPAKALPLTQAQRWQLDFDLVNEADMREINSRRFDVPNPYEKRARWFEEMAQGYELADLINQLFDFRTSATLNDEAVFTKLYALGRAGNEAAACMAEHFHRSLSREITARWKVSNEDIGFVRPGQPVKLKFAAFPFQKYGMVQGRVEHVGADAADAGASPGAPPAQDGKKATPLAYKALVSLQSQALALDGERFSLSAGMQSQAEIWLGDRSVAEYLLSPVRKAWHEAARER